MAIIHNGRVVAEGDPLALASELRSRVWSKVVTRPELPELQRTCQVLSTRLRTGRTLVHVYSDESPDASYEPVEPELEDVYFCAIRGHAAKD